jgi:hypothetical protein
LCYISSGMLKYLAIFLALAACCVDSTWGQRAQPAAGNPPQSSPGSSPQPAPDSTPQSTTDNVPAQGQSRGRHHRRAAQATTQENPAPPVAPKPEAQPPVTQDKEQKVAAVSPAPISPVIEQKGLSDRVFEWGPWAFDLLLVLVAGLQVWLLLRTWRTIEGHNTMQAAAMTQWVDLQPQGVFVDRGPDDDQAARVTANLQWKIFNRTGLPLTIQTVEAYICRRKDWEVFEYTPNEVIAPVNSEGRQNHYMFTAPLHLTKAETKRFLEEGIALSVTIGITYEDAMGKTRRQDFGDMYNCGAGRLEIKESLGDSPSRTFIEKGDNPTSIRIREVAMPVPIEAADAPEEEQG